MPKKGILLFSLFALTQISAHYTQCAHATLQRTVVATARTLSTRAGQRAYASSPYNQHAQSTSSWRQRMRRLAAFGLCAGTVAWQKNTLAEKFNAHATLLPASLIGPLVALGCTEIIIDPETNRTVLHTAAIYGEKKLVALLILNKAYLDPKDTSGTTPLFAALAMGHVTIAKMLIQAGADKSNLRARNCGSTPLHACLMQPKVDFTKLRKLLAWQKKRKYAEIDVNAQDEDGDTPLLFAIARRHHAEEGEKDKWLKIITLLLKHGANPFLRNHKNLCAHDVAFALSGDEELVPSFNQGQERLAELEAESGREVFTSLHEAAARGSEDAARTLVERGFCLDAKDTNGLTVLFVVLINGHTSVAEILLEGGAKNMKAPIGNLTPLHIIAANPEGIAELDKLLEWQQERGWKEMGPNCSAGKGMTPLIMAAAAGNILAIDVLHRYGADLAQKDTKGNTAYNVAMIQGQNEAAAFIATLIQQDKNKEDAQVKPNEADQHTGEELLS